jgi:broad specificity phosphatase PhoE
VIRSQLPAIMKRSLHGLYRLSNSLPHQQYHLPNTNFRPRFRHHQLNNCFSSFNTINTDNDNHLLEPSNEYNYPNNQYNRAKRIILIRHGESLGNVDEATYVSQADWRIPLTDKGKEQAVNAGKTISNLLGEEGKAFFYVSPYKRTRQTLKGIMSQLDRPQIHGVREEPRIAEQQFGNFQNVKLVQDAKNERKSFGRFFYRFPNGEAGFDVYSRVTSFISTVMRDCTQLRAEKENFEEFNICIVTHGLTLRLFLMRWFQYSVTEFESSFNPNNGAVIILERKTNPTSGLQWYELTKESRESLRLPKYEDQQRFHIKNDLGLLDNDI